MTKRYLDAARGEMASDDSVASGKVEVIIENPSNGNRTSYGLLVQRRQCGPFQLRLSHDRTSGMWWITALSDGHIAVIGFREQRAAECRQLFSRITPDQLARAAGLPS